MFQGKANYDEVKGVCDTELGIMSQCMALSNLTGKRQRGPGRERGGGGGVDPGTMANLLHKVGRIHGHTSCYRAGNVRCAHVRDCSGYAR